MHTLSRVRRKGFTLIEMMIAVALGTLVVYTALAGFRTLSQALTTSKQLATENALLRTGMALALEEVDFWIESDNPDDTNRQQMRGTNGRFAGMPFTPFRSIDDPLGLLGLAGIGGLQPLSHPCRRLNKQFEKGLARNIRPRPNRQRDIAVGTGFRHQGGNTVI